MASFDFAAARKQLDDKYQSTRESINETERLFKALDVPSGAASGAASVAAAKRHKRPKHEKSAQSARALVQAALSSWNTVAALIGATGLGSSQVRGVLNAKDIKAKIEKRPDGKGVLEYRLKPG